MEHRFCRLCEDRDDVRNMIKYSPVSYAHWACQLKRKSLGDGMAWLRSLPFQDIRQAPVLIVQDWLNDRNWKGTRSLELLLNMAKEAKVRETAR